jgi:hypothetical protein
MMQQFVELLGPPLRPADREAFAEFERAWGLRLPADMALVLSAYGDSVIADQVRLYGPQTIRHVNELLGPSISDLAEHDGLPPVGREPGQLLLWGDTVDGDALASEVQSSPQWATVYFNGGLLEWGRDEAGFARWLHAALAGGMRDLFPEWQQLPHQVVELGLDDF